MKKEVYKLAKSRLNLFLNNIKKNYELIAPVKTDVSRFQIINNVKDVHLENLSYFPVKKFFLQNNQTLFNINKDNFKTTKQKINKKVFFGLRKCDLNAIYNQDLVFNEIDDPYYKQSRKNSILIGLHCNTPPSKYCFCESLDLIDFFDLMFYDQGKYYLIEVGSEIGIYLTKDLTKTKEQIKIIPMNQQLKLEAKDIDKVYHHHDWYKAVELCLSCASCTAVCPTCYCFEIKDEVDSNNINLAKRIRSCSSCQLKSFTQVSGDFVFRDKRDERFKHRIYHQLSYFKKRYKKHLCVGCGRCISACPTRIDFISLINSMS
jgi:sulfhydrogenase subunit beta (sulfur reductase)